MIEESEINALVSNVLSENRYSHCRLCLKDIQDHYVRFQDSVSFDSTSFQPLSEVLDDLLGDEVCEEISGIDAVCMTCVDKALECLNFIKNCKKSTEVLKNVFNNLTSSLNVDLNAVTADQSLYIAVTEQDCQLILVKNATGKKKPNTQTDSFVCEKCNDTLDDESDLTAHEQSQDKYECSECDEFRCTEESLKQHKDAAHGVYVCKDCGKSFKSLDKLQVHEQKHVSKSECPKCGKSYNTKGYFLKHVKLCLEDRLDPHPIRSKIVKTYFCEKCGKGYSTPGGLRVHHRFVHGNAKPHVCKYCNKQFTAPSYLKVHMIKHTGEKNFKCYLCSRLFVSKEALLYHTRRHTGDKPYSCTLCDERFVNASARAEHIKFKHVGPTLMCEICSRKFFTPHFLKQHIKKHHDPSNKLYAGRSLIPPNVPAVENMRVRFRDSLKNVIVNQI
ncbi:zinc finger protein 664-like [Spodoptera litura]|uniref:Zinc finger protein 664-like n=1 Tax=Spodoptera litura TaxID=69820 RepID=A0A9J7ECK9_SPOLT|nr:zinc finger protein 664-like [Spodoptera litura]